MISTPITDFARKYAESTRGRFHMPGHKGRGPMGFEALDLTEISGADSLYEADGIIAESEKNASALFGCPTFYSAEGSSLAIRAMLYLALARKSGRAKVLAARNAHRAFVYSAALIDFEIAWLYPETPSSCHACPLTPADVERGILNEKPDAVYLTSPDYLGNIQDIRGISEVCKRHNTLLLVDAAHGAYLRFLTPSLHPMDLGADMCCSSAHKTLPAVTGGAYLHTNKAFAARAKTALELFASTSPSYLILESLDACNPYLETLGKRLDEFRSRIAPLRARLEEAGYILTGDEISKLTIRARAYGYTGNDLAHLIESKGLFTEFHDSDYLVLMAGPENTPEELSRLEAALLSIPKRPALASAPPAPCRHEYVMSPREALFSPRETIPTLVAFGRVLASACVSCPPAIPIVISGERIDESAIEAFEYYGINELTVVKENENG